MKTIAFLAAATMIHAAPADVIVVEDLPELNHTTLSPLSSSWGQFCDDENCKENCGMSVRLSNPGCLGQRNRKSLKLHGPGYQMFEMALIASPGETCNCQKSCMTLNGPGACIKLEDTSALSYRFIDTICPENNC